MPEGSDPLIRLEGVSKDYRSLRPLRIERLELRPKQSLSLLGFDASMAEVLVNLVTGASLPDTGNITCFGQSTSEIANVEVWMSMLDRFGLLSNRAVLIEQLTAEQSLAMPLTLELEDMPPEIRDRTRALAAELALSSTELETRVAGLSPAAQLRVRLGRALALNPQVLLAEHPNAMLPAEHVLEFAALLKRIVTARSLAALVLTADRTFATAATDEVLAFQPATGALKPSSGWRRLFG
jgi:ABC-type lipoprotein export system ATPase subunit